jgi:hypothetical protein
MSSANFTKQTRSNVQFNVGTNEVGANSVLLNQMNDISFGNFPQTGAGLALTVDNDNATDGNPAGIRMLIPSESNNSLVLGSSSNDYLTELYNDIIINNGLDNQVIIGQEDPSGVKNFTILGNQGTNIYTSQAFNIFHSDFNLIGSTSGFVFNISGEDNPPGLFVNVSGGNDAGNARISLQHAEGNGIVIDETGVTITGLTSADPTQITDGTTTISTTGGVDIDDENNHLTLDRNVGLVTVSGLEVANNADVTGDLGITGLTSGSNALFNGHISGGSLDVATLLTGDGANFTGHISGGTLDVNGLLTGDGANFTGHISGGSLVVTGDSIVVGLTSGSNANFVGHISGGSLDVAGLLTGDGADFGHISGDSLDLTGLLTGDGANFNGHISGDSLDLTGLLTGDGANFIGHISGSTLDVNGLLAGEGADFNGHISGASLDVVGLLTAEGADFNGHISGGSLDITNEAVIGNGITVTGNSTFNNDLTVEGNLTILGESTTTTTVANELDICDNIIRLNYGGAIRDAGIIFDEVTSGQTDVCGVADTGAASLFFDAEPGSGGFVLGFVNSANGASMTDTSGDRFELINVSGDLMDRYCDLIVRNVTAKEVSQVSDRSLKKDIEGFENGLELITNMRPVKYHWNNEPETAEKQYGFVAQELEEVVPSIVNSTGDVKSVAYPKITSILVQAVKEQQRQIDQLKKQML